MPQTPTQLPVACGFALRGARCPALWGLPPRADTIKLRDLK